MYCVRLCMRSITNELRIIDHRVMYSSKSAPKKRKGRYYITPDLVGIRRQLKESGLTPEEFPNHGDFAGGELDMSAAEGIYDAFERENRSNRLRRELAAYGQKYYRPKPQPPLLSCADMDQIRHLANNENWPVEELAKSFPASESIIKKILKSKSVWTPEKTIEHDQIVEENWNLLRKGKLDMDEHLRQHCLKFTNRVASSTSVKDVAVKEKKKSLEKIGAFSALLLSPEEIQERKKLQEEATDESKGRKEESRVQPSKINKCDDKAASKRVETRVYIDSEDDSKTKDTVKYRKQEYYTLKEARKISVESSSPGQTPKFLDKLFVLGDKTNESAPPENKIEDKGDQVDHSERTPKSQPQDLSVGTKVVNDFKVFHSKWDSSGKSVKATKDAIMAPYDDYPEYITIPEAVKKPGALYQLEDCFYNEKGEFLYRVPGLKA